MSTASSTGGDVPPRCADKYIAQLEEHMKRIGLGKNRHSIRKVLRHGSGQALGACCKGLRRHDPAGGISDGNGLRGGFRGLRTG